MPCYYPIKGWRAKRLSPSGKRPIVFNPNDGFRDQPVTVPCGSCIGCRLQRSKDWATRCVQESQLYPDNCFITLTYAPDALPKNGSLDVRDFQNFMKRLRKRYASRKIRFFHCGEYGDKGSLATPHGRPHYHAILFNLDFDDKYHWADRNGYPVYRSDTLEKLWSLGICEIGSVTFESAAYIARYVTKKITGKKSLEHYALYTDLQTGEVISRKPEYVTMSRRPGIGHEWFNRFKGDFYPKDYMHLGDHVVRPPRYYDELLEAENPRLMARIKRKRLIRAKDNESDNTFMRLIAKQEVKERQYGMLTRPYDEEV